MKQILVLFIAIVTFCSCEKRYNYECSLHDTTTQAVAPIVHKHCTENQIERFIKENTKDLDGIPNIITQGEKWAICTKK